MGRLSQDFAIKADAHGNQYTEILDTGRVYPPARELQEVSIRVATRVIRCALEEGVAHDKALLDRDVDAYMRSRFWHPRHLPFVRGKE
jgi:malate dehydrogenase (oxaloacetate-decarboxylating)